jgi:hypothetical protein
VDPGPTHRSLRRWDRAERTELRARCAPAEHCEIALDDDVLDLMANVRERLVILAGPRLHPFGPIGQAWPGRPVQGKTSSANDRSCMFQMLRTSARTSYVGRPWLRALLLDPSSGIIHPITDESGCAPSGIGMGEP